ncbi:hypothetical protein [Sphingopyxis sp.]|uniref:hypothetical protein n=1 Tax=Sphingopyxis sp. TaxID=1908224 RepID=UPI002E12EDCF
MAMLLLTILLFAEPVSTAIDQLGADDRGEPIEQVAKSGNSAFVEDGPAPEKPGGEVLQLSAADNEVSLGRVEGIDRCSAELLSADDKAYCNRRIETRSAEFRSDLAAPLSLEQKLVGERLVPLRGIENAARTSDASAKDSDVQALASIALTPPSITTPPGDPAAPGNLSTETQALIDAIVTKLAGPGDN